MIADIHKLRISGSAAVRLSDFGIRPSSLPGEHWLAKVDDEVKLSFDWVLRRAGAGRD